jgi:FkbM family methyltransferase
MKVQAKSLGVDRDGDQVIVALGRHWHWPAEDTECWPVVFEWSPDLEIVYGIMQRIGKSFRSVVQAGGNMGVWPWLLSQRFSQVYTFEPDPRCFKHLVRNCCDRPNILYYQAALGDEHLHVSIKNLPGEETNLGAQYVEGADHTLDRIPTLMIDDFALYNVDLIYLDIEGYEYFALHGGIQTIGQCKPVIVVEDKGLSEKFGTKKGEIEDWLAKQFGYSVAARPHRDVILVP